MAAKNDVTGDLIKSRAASDTYAQNYDRIFSKPELPEGRIAVKDCKRGQRVYDLDEDDSYKVYSDAKVVKGEWTVETTSEGDFNTVFKSDALLWVCPKARDSYLAEFLSQKLQGFPTK